MASTSWKAPNPKAVVCSVITSRVQWWKFRKDWLMTSMRKRKEQLPVRSQVFVRMGLWPRKSASQKGAKQTLERKSTWTEILYWDQRLKLNASSALLNMFYRLIADPRLLNCLKLWFFGIESAVSGRQSRDEGDRWSSLWPCKGAHGCPFNARRSRCRVDAPCKWTYMHSSYVCNMI